MAEGLRRYRAAPHAEPGQPQPDARFVDATGDFDALAQARRLLGAGAHFELWDGERLVHVHRPVQPDPARRRSL